MPTDALARFHRVFHETMEYGFQRSKDDAFRLGAGVRAAFAARGFDSVAAKGFEAPGVVVVEPQLNTAAAIAEQLRDKPPTENQGTPTASALTAAGEILMANPSENDFIILATDGGPLAPLRPLLRMERSALLVPVALAQSCTGIPFVGIVQVPVLADAGRPRVRGVLRIHLAYGSS